jgi:predicted DNA-binding protein YlxM (UPF0122 family)
MNYLDIHHLYKGFSKSAISRKLKISRNRVIDYLKMSPEDFEEFSNSLRTRRSLSGYSARMVKRAS